jgi:hypothetical protein
MTNTGTKAEPKPVKATPTSVLVPVSPNGEP